MACSPIGLRTKVLWQLQFRSLEVTTKVVAKIRPSVLGAVLVLRCRALGATIVAYRCTWIAAVVFGNVEEAIVQALRDNTADERPCQAAHEGAAKQSITVAVTSAHHRRSSVEDALHDPWLLQLGARRHPG